MDIFVQNFSILCTARKCQTYVDICSILASMPLHQGTLQNSNSTEPPGSIDAHANPGQLLGSLLSGHSAQLLRFAVADFMILLLFHFHSRKRLECQGYQTAQIWKLYSSTNWSNQGYPRDITGIG